jgi:hypothetical protein
MPTSPNFSPLPRASLTSSWATQQSLAILAVDNIRPSLAGRALMYAMDAGSKTYDEVINSIATRAHQYAQQGNQAGVK